MLLPMLAGKVKDATALPYPLYGSPKVDGVRFTVQDAVVLSRKLKPIPNAQVQKMFGRQAFNGFDGELIVGPPTAADVCRHTTSVVMSQSDEPVSAYVFDLIGGPKDMPYFKRLALVQERARRIRAQGFSEWLFTLEHVKLETALELVAHEERYLEAGFEGLMLRVPHGLYKHGRSTLAESYLLKLKRFDDAEAVVLSCVPKMHNANTATVSETGHTKRSSHKANKHALDLLGALHVRDCKSKVEFDIGTGFSLELQRDLWAARDQLPGKIVKYKFFPTGSKEKPRFPVFISFRSSIDM